MPRRQTITLPNPRVRRDVRRRRRLRVAPDRTVVLHADSSYALGLLGKGWKAKANQEIVERMRTVAKKFRDLRLVKVDGHAGVAENERADELARTAVVKRS